MTSPITEQARQVASRAIQEKPASLDSSRASTVLGPFLADLLALQRFLAWADALLAGSSFFSHQAPHIAGPNQVPPAPG